ncbi:FtsX-like permease family protein [Dissulfurirhabdus thermomarina]|uniref:FtsX-like permease family protein n=1 Tax=Dissulfurirhabdus thermomarina TaxID=1765737 RepID=A0A6N9TP50_DISTH|nr:FtsX-like permease family protein [Dissulfurirhabdus thermomarina]NDY43035.1 FtsX-like permease family protein [Dissulfurirhabdus thermomarina]NMX22727.1 FtsX-like permease family protein [Dissulfurirhabdus thermomarina]
MAFEGMVARRYLRAKRTHAFVSLITLISIGGVTLGVMALIVVLSVMGGFEDHLRTKILGINSHILVRSYKGPFAETPEIRRAVLSARVQPPPLAGLWDRLRGQGGAARVLAATPVVYVQALLTSGRAVSGALVRGVDPASVTSVVTVGDTVRGRGLDALMREGPGPPPILMGKELARTLGVDVGHPVQLVLPGGTLTPVGMLPKIRRFRVAGLLTTGMYEYDASLAFVSLRTAQRLLGLGTAVHGLEVRVSDIYAADRLADLIRERLGYPFWTMDWQQMSRNLFAALKLEKIALSIVLALIVLVAAFNIVSTLIMMVMEKKEDIAILKAMGATDRQILKIFVYTGSLIGLTGTALGAAGGVGLCELLARYKFIKIPSEISQVYYTDTLPMLLNGMDVVFIVAAALVICFLATLYPARQAARVEPAKALRTG